MNPFLFNDGQFLSLLESHKERMCRIRVLGENGYVIDGMFVCVTECKKSELPDMGGFIADVPIYKCCVLARTDNGTLSPVWINTLLIDKFEDIEFL